MSLWQFQSRPTSMASKDLLTLRARLGGSIGRLVSGMDTVDALQVAANVYVTAKEPAKALQAMVNLSGSDIHTPDHAADIQLLADRLKAFTGIPLGPLVPGSLSPKRRI